MLGGGGNAALAQTVTDVKARQRWPWNNLVDIDYTVSGMGTETNGLYIRFHIANETLHLDHEAGALVPEPSLENGRHRVTWDAEADGVRLESDGMVCRAMLRRDDPCRYLVIDLSGGPSAAEYRMAYLPAAPAGGWGDEYKTTKLVMRKIDPGTFTMGSPSGELGRQDDREDEHRVTLTKGFYIGVFEVTQSQWKLVMGDNPSYWQGKGWEVRPVESVSYDMIRGGSAGTNWPASSDVDADSFLGRVRSKTRRAFDLPTDAQWECACRAGTTNALNSGKDLTGLESCRNLADIGRYAYNEDDGRGDHTKHTAVGSYLPNAWGLYGMHGNVWEWCRDWFKDHLGTADAVDPAGPDYSDSKKQRVFRGGAWYYDAKYCRSARRSLNYPSDRYDYGGLRLVCPAGH